MKMTLLMSTGLFKAGQNTNGRIPGNVRAIVTEAVITNGEPVSNKTWVQIPTQGQSEVKFNWTGIATSDIGYPFPGFFLD